MVARRVVPPALLTLAVLGVYALTLYPTVNGGDGGELIAAAATGGVPHPPGYPLFAILARLASDLPGGTVAWRINFMTALLGALAAGVLSAAVSRATGQWWAGVFAGGMFAFAPLVWEYSIGAEVFALNHLLVAVLILLAVSHLDTGQPRTAVLGAFVFGLGMSNHHTILFVGIPLAVMIVARVPARWLTPRAIGALVGAFLLGLTPYLYLPIANANLSLATWGDARSWNGFLTHLARREYGTLQLGADAYAADVSFAQQLWLYATSQLHQLLYLGVALAAAGFVVLWRDSRLRPAALWLGSALALYVLVFHALANLPVGNPLFLEVQKRFWLMPTLLLAVVAGAGAASLGRRFWFAPAAALLLVFVQLGINYRAADRSDAAEFAAYGRALLAPLPADAILLARGDLIINTIQHAQLIDGVRRDVRLLDLERLSYPWMAAVVRTRMPDVVLPGAVLGPNGYALRELIAANAGRPLYFAGNLARGEDDVASGWQFWPLGMTNALVPAGKPVDAAEWLRANSLALPDIEVRHRPPGSWSAVVWQDVLGARHTRAVKILELGIAQEDPTLLRLAAQELETLLNRYPDVTPLAWRNLGLAWGRLAPFDASANARMRAAWQRYLTVGDPSDPQLQAIRQILAQP